MVRKARKAVSVLYQCVRQMLPPTLPLISLHLSTYAYLFYQPTSAHKQLPVSSNENNRYEVNAATHTGPYICTPVLDVIARLSGLISPLWTHHIKKQ